jgi:hypothetical protein
MGFQSSTPILQTHQEKKTIKILIWEKCKPTNQWLI